MSYPNIVNYNNNTCSVDNDNKLICDTNVEVFYKLKHMVYRLNILESIINENTYLLKQPILKRDTNIIINDCDIDNLLIDINDRLYRMENKLPLDITKSLCEQRLENLEKYIYKLVQNNIFDEN